MSEWGAVEGIIGKPMRCGKLECCRTINKTRAFMGALLNMSADMHVRLCADKTSYKYGVSELLERAVLLTCSDRPEVIQSDAEANTEAPLLR